VARKNALEKIDEILHKVDFVALIVEVVVFDEVLVEVLLEDASRVRELGHEAGKPAVRTREAGLELEVRGLFPLFVGGVFG
jgi:hypothetical protein